MADTKAEKPDTPMVPDEETRYRFIGLEVYPKKAKEFWKSEGEYRQFVERARDVKTIADLDRDFSLVNVPDITQIDRVVLTVSNALLLVSLFLPWLSYRTAAGEQSSMWFGVWGKLGSALGGAFSVSAFTGLALLCGVGILVATPVLAIWALAAVYRKPASPEGYTANLRKVLRLNYFGFGVWLLGVVFLLPGGEISPLVSSGIVGLGDRFTVLTAIGLLSYAPAVGLGMFLLNAIKSNDL